MIASPEEAEIASLELIAAAYKFAKEKGIPHEIWMLALQKAASYGTPLGKYLAENAIETINRNRERKGE